MNEVLLYGLIWSQSAIEFIDEINEIEGDELVVRINSQGGDVHLGYGMVAKFAEFNGIKRVKIDGQAASMAAFYLLYADNVEALDVSRIMFHRASYGMWYEENMPDSARQELIEMNKNIEAAFRAKVDVKKFEELKGVKVKDLFSLDGRIEVFLSASEAKQVGLVNTINKITPQKKSQINAEMNRIAATYTGVDFNSNPHFGIDSNKDIEDKQQINTKMNIEELKAKHPEVYAQAIALGKAEGTEQERDRVGAWAAYSSVDAEAVKSGIESGKNISQTQMAEFAIKMVSAEKKAQLEKESNGTPAAGAAAATPENGDGEKPNAVAEFGNAVLGHLNIKPKND